MAGISFEDYAAHDATGLAARVRRGEIAPVELLETALARLEATNGRFTSVVAVHADYARRRLARLRPGGRLAGVPFLIKDLFTDLAGTFGTNGSSFCDERPAAASSTVVDRWEAEGLVVFGRTHSPEFGGTSTTESRRFGATPNPFDPRRSAGGSSGGSAVAVATGVVPAAHATDAGGSIVIPASCCGLFGLKPTRGRVPLGPSRVEGAGGLAAQHVLTRSVRDSALLLDVETRGPIEVGIAPPLAEGGFARAAAIDPPPLRIGVLDTSVHGLRADDECRAALDEAVALCRSLGHRVVTVTLPVEAEPLLRAERSLRLASIAATVRGLEARVGRAAVEADLEPATWERFRAGLEVSGVEVLAAREHMARTGLALARFMRRHDVLLSPTMAGLPPLLGTIGLDRADETALRLNRRCTTFAGLYNWTGQPAMSVPLATAATGLPIGLLFAGRHGEEDLLLRLAAQLERARPWAGATPTTASP